MIIQQSNDMSMDTPQLIFFPIWTIAYIDPTDISIIIRDSELLWGFRFEKIFVTSSYGKHEEKTAKFYCANFNMKKPHTYRMPMKFPVRGDFIVNMGNRMTVQE